VRPPGTGLRRIRAVKVDNLAGRLVGIVVGNPLGDAPMRAGTVVVRHVRHVLGQHGAQMCLVVEDL
jgi:hypothetical protein